jgi:hypothetical protein
MFRVLLVAFTVSLGIALLLAPFMAYGMAAHLLDAIGAEPVRPLAIGIAVIAEVSYVFGAGVYATAYLRQRQ